MITAVPALDCLLFESIIQRNVEVRNYMLAFFCSAVFIIGIISGIFGGRKRSGTRDYTSKNLLSFLFIDER